MQLVSYTTHKKKLSLLNLFIPVAELDYVLNYNHMVLFNGSYSVGDSECVTVNVSVLSDKLVEGTESFAFDLDKLNTTVTIFIIDSDCKCMYCCTERRATVLYTTCRLKSWL